MHNISRYPELGGPDRDFRLPVQSGAGSHGGGEVSQETEDEARQRLQEEDAEAEQLMRVLTAYITDIATRTATFPGSLGRDAELTHDRIRLLAAIAYTLHLPRVEDSAVWSKLGRYSALVILTDAIADDPTIEYDLEPGIEQYCQTNGLDSFAEQDFAQELTTRINDWEQANPARNVELQAAAVRLVSFVGGGD